MTRKTCVSKGIVFVEKWSQYKGKKQWKLVTERALCCIFKTTCAYKDCVVKNLL